MELEKQVKLKMYPGFEYTLYNYTYMYMAIMAKLTPTKVGDKEIFGEFNPNVYDIKVAWKFQAYIMDPIRCRTSNLTIQSIRSKAAGDFTAGVGSNDACGALNYTVA